jgi:spore coat polysaccharide biosynthesis predicted glycosyltransferase SpsG
VIKPPRDIPAEREWQFLASLNPVPEVVIVDLYRPSQSAFDGLQGPWTLVAVDDDSPLLIDADLLVVPDLNDGFTHRVTPRTAVMRGGEAIILREEFDALPPHRTAPALSHLLICLGGSDPADFTRCVTGWLRPGLPAGIDRVTVIVGKSYPHYEDLSASLPEDGRWRLLRDVPSVVPMMAAADAGLVAGGTLLYEAACTGLPIVAVSQNESQAREIRVAAGAGAAIDLGPVQTATAAAVQSALIRLGDPGLRAEMTRRAATLVRPGGRLRVAERIVHAWRARRSG